ncbi:hypothetical protein E3Q00_03782 [Wallemia mellicola]|nr:hypothetical protein E3Q00_03782 [Wallemia mellicola]
MDKLNNLGIDNNTKALLAAIIALQLLHLFKRTDSVVHPIILSNQSEASPVRNQNQSAIYRNSSLGNLPLVERPAAKARGAADLLELSDNNARMLIQSQPYTPSTLIDQAVKAISSISKHTTLLKSKTSTILIATQDVHIAVLIELGALLIGMQTAHINANDNIAVALTKFEEHGAQITAIVADDKLGILPRHLNDVLCVFTKSIPPNVGLNYVKFEVDALVEPLSIDKNNREPSNTISYVLSNDTVYKMDNKNITAGVYSILSTVPLAKKPAHNDTIVTDEPLSTALGRTLLYTSIFSGCSYFCIPQDAALPLSPVPQYLFVSGKHLSLLAHDLSSIAINKWWYKFSRRQALAADAAGQIPPPSNWGVFRRVRDTIGLNNGLKYVVSTDGEINDSTVTDLRISLSVPIVKAFKDPRSSSFVFSRIAYDTLKNGGLGPPTYAIEVRLADGGLDEFSGRLQFRGPCVLEGHSDQFSDSTNQSFMKILESGSFELIKTQK